MIVFLSEFEECHNGYPHIIRFRATQKEMRGGLYVQNSYWDLDILDEHNTVIYSKLLSKWKLKAHTSNSLDKVKFVAKNVIKEFAYCIKSNVSISDSILIVKKICGTCKYWSGRKILGCTSGNCDIEFHNRRREEYCERWEY